MTQLYAPGLNYTPFVNRLSALKDREELEDDFLSFFKASWPSIDNHPYEESWAIDAMCDHLEAMTLGQIRRLLINIPPRCSKTSTVSIAWPAWIWARRDHSFLSGPHVKFLAASYNNQLSLESANKMRRLITSPWYQSYWGDRYNLRFDQNTKTQFDNTAGGSRISTSVRGSLLGLGGDVISVDDPHNTQTELTIESDSDRNAVRSWWSELSSTRLNSPKDSVIAVTMQRLHQGDLSGVILEAMDNDEEDWVHLCIPNEFDTRRRNYTVILPQWNKGEPWTDPREKDGELMWPERLGKKETAANKKKLGLYMYAGRYQQMPVPKGGGIIKDDWWQTWDHQAAMRYGRIWNKQRMEFPNMELVVGSIDTAMTEKDENNFSAMTVWGVWLDYMGNKRVMLMYAWAKRLGLHNPPVTKVIGETAAEFKIRKRDNMGLVERVAATCSRYHVQRLLIEDKTRGPDLAAELVRLYQRENWGIERVPVARDKVSRTHSVVPLFTDGMIYAPDTTWSEAVITNCALFPKGEHDDLHDTVTQFLNWARVNNILLRVEEAEAEREQEMLWKPREETVAALYNVG